MRLLKDEEMKIMKDEIEEMKLKKCDCCSEGVPRAGVMFDAIFHEPKQNESEKPVKEQEADNANQNQILTIPDPPPAVLTIEEETPRTPIPSQTKEVVPPFNEPASENNVEDPADIPDAPTNTEHDDIEQKVDENDNQVELGDIPKDGSGGVVDPAQNDQPVEAPPKKKKAAKGKGKGKKKKPKKEDENKEE